MKDFRLMYSRVSELYGKDIVFYVSFIVAAACFVISIPLGVIAAYLWFCLFSYLLWLDDRPPFSWQDNDAAKWILVALGPFTALGIMIGTLLWIAFAPFIEWRSVRSRPGDNPPKLKNWLIGGSIYYAFLAGVVTLIIALL